MIELGRTNVSKAVPLKHCRPRVVIEGGKLLMIESFDAPENASSPISVIFGLSEKEMVVKPDNKNASPSIVSSDEGNTRNVSEEHK